MNAGAVPAAAPESTAGVPLLSVGAGLMAFGVIIGIGVLSRQSRVNHETPRLRRPFGIVAIACVVVGLVLVIVGLVVR